MLSRRAVLVLILCLASRPCLRAADEAPDFRKTGRPFLVKHCVKCHSGDDPQAELDLDRFKESSSLIRERKVWNNVLRMIAVGDMPPKRRPRPAVAEIESFTNHIRAVFDHHDRNAEPDPGRVTMRRLNRTEYRNTIRDLVWADFNPTEGFPADDIGHGFDNIGDVLTLSPLLMERYLDAAETIAGRVILVNPPKPARRYLAGRYLQPNNAQTSQARFRVLDPTAEEPVHSGPFTAPGSYLKFSADAELFFRATLYAEPEADAPVMVALFIIGRDIEPSSESERAAFLGTNQGALKQAKILEKFEITARSADKPQELEVRIDRVGGIQNAGIALLKPPEGQTPAKLHIQHLWSEGPLETRPVSHIRLLSRNKDKQLGEQTREVMSRFLQRAYRRPPTDQEVDRVSALVSATMDGGLKWEAGIQRAITAVLCSPKFLFRVELDDRPTSPQPEPLDEFQLASRLSYFLWSTMPDDELFKLAGQKKLTAGIDSQVRRMLADGKSGELVRNFARQWLQIQRLEEFNPDSTLFPTFNERLRTAMLRETDLFFDSIMREDRSILELIEADYTFLNEPLARHYGIADTNGNWLGQKSDRPRGNPFKGDTFQRVTLHDRTRGGLLTQASVLTVTSNPTRTSPVKRGRWVLEQLLGTPPPPPPPNVPELPEDESAVATGSLRQRLEIHRKNPSCANCHAKMDPIGFALERYNAIGGHRQKDGEFTIDPSGEFADGTKFKGAPDLKTILRQQKKTEFTRCLTEKMLTYALGRGVEYYDRPAVERIVKAVAASDYRFSALVTEIVKSDPFRKRRGTEPAD